LLSEINYFEVRGYPENPASPLSLNDSSRADALKAAKCVVILAVKKQIFPSPLPSGYGLWRLYVGSLCCTPALHNCPDCIKIFLSLPNRHL